MKWAWFGWELVWQLLQAVLKNKEHFLSPPPPLPLYYLWALGQESQEVGVWLGEGVWLILDEREASLQCHYRTCEYVLEPV